jgi:hypothetical protein
MILLSVILDLLVMELLFQFELIAIQETFSLHVAFAHPKCNPIWVCLTHISNDSSLFSEIKRSF